MIGSIIHVGVTVSDLERSIAFYRDILGLAPAGQLTMEGPATEALFARQGAAARVAYFKAEGSLQGPPVELIQFTSHRAGQQPTDLFTTSVSEICFAVEDIWQEYRRLRELGVEFLSEPQQFDFSTAGMGRSWAVYCRDPDGLILELLQAAE